MEKLRLSRKEREYLRHRRDILRVALELFSEKGFHNVSMHEIAEESEFAVGTLYKFFSNKDELYRALMLEKAQEFHAVLKAALEAPGDEIKKIGAWLKAKIKVFMDNLDSVRLYFAETRGASFNIKAGLDKEIRRDYEITIKAIEGLFRKGIKKKLFAEFDPHLLALALDGISNAFLFEYLEHPDKYPVDANLILRIFFHPVYQKERMEKCDIKPV